jgi:hypothetical protein
MENKKKSGRGRWLIPLALAGAVAFGGYHLSRTPNLERERPAVVQTVDDYKPSVGVDVENDFAYEDNDIWHQRMDSLENLAVNSAKNDITSETIKDLREIAQGDEDWRIRGLANSMIESYATNRDFSDTEPFERKVAAEKRLALDVENDFGYDVNNIWYDRMDALENITINTDYKVTGETLSDLRVIEEGDDDARIRSLANSMIRSYEQEGDFSQTEPHSREVAKDNRLTLQVKGDFGYTVGDIWYDRLDAVENLVPERINTGIATDLVNIALKEDDWRVQSKAIGKLMRAYDVNGKDSYEGVDLQSLNELRNSHATINGQLDSFLGRSYKGN